jgi:hypothetical protein
MHQKAKQATLSPKTPWKSDFQDGWRHLINQNIFVKDNKPSISNEFLQNLFAVKTKIEADEQHIQTESSNRDQGLVVISPRTGNKEVVDLLSVDRVLLNPTQPSPKETRQLSTQKSARDELSPQSNKSLGPAMILYVDKNKDATWRQAITIPSKTADGERTWKGIQRSQAHQLLSPQSI